MIELTVRVPDDVAARLSPIRNQLPALLQQIAQTLPAATDPGDLPTSTAPDATAFPVYTEVLDFLMSSPTPQEILSFKVSTETQDRLRALLEKNREGTLTGMEEAELDAYEQIEHIMILLKAHAHSQLKATNASAQQ